LVPAVKPVHVYVVLVAGVALQLAPTVAGDGVTLYEVIAEPPLSAGTSKVTVILLPLVTAATFAGADGTPAGITTLDALDCAEEPTVVIAATLNV
jgi:hypothetical protein